MTRKGLWKYENGLLLMLGMSFGFAFFDRNAVNYLAPYIVDDLKINYTQVGTLGSVLALSWAISGLVISKWSDSVGVRKPFLIGILLVFSACSILSGLATSYPMLLLARLIMGIAEGPLMPICLAILIVESTPSRRGLNIGLVQSLFSSLFGAAIAPVILERLATWFSWRVAFFIAGIPGIICALLILRFMREPKAPPAVKRQVAGDGDAVNFRMFFQRNIWLCAVMACLMVSWLMLHQSFLLLFFTKIRHFTVQQGAWLFGITGICAMLSGFTAAGISDRVGRKPVIVTACLLSLLTPLAALYFDGPLSVLALLLFIGWIGTAAFSLFMAVVPGETLPARHAATASAFVVCIGEVVGGAGSQYLGGWAADLTSLAAPIKIAAACALGGTFFSLFLKETAPIKTGSAAQLKSKAH